MPTRESGKWRNAYMGAMREISGLQLELDSLKKENEMLKDQIEKAKNYIGIEGWPCPLCTYRHGKFIKRCALHKRIYELEAELACGLAGKE